MAFIRGAVARAKDSALSLARALGEISPKISTTTVMTAVETLTPASASHRVNTTVASEEEAMLTILFPIRIVEISLS